MLTFVMFVFVTLGACLTLREVIGRDEGWEPYCPTCGYCLLGLRDAPDVCCPECRAAVSRTTVLVHGRRVRRWQRLAVGVGLVLIGGVFLVPRVVTGRASMIAALVLPDTMLVEQMPPRTEHFADPETGYSEAVRARLINGTLSEEGVARLVALMVEEAHRPPLFASHPFAESIGVALKQRSVAPESVGRLARALEALQRESALPVTLHGVTDRFDDMLATPRLTTRDRASVLAFVEAHFAALADVAGRPSSAGPHLRNYGTALNGALRDRTLALPELAPLIAAGMRPRLAVDDPFGVAPGDTVPVGVTFDLEPFIGLDLPVSFDVWPVGARDASWHFAGAVVEPAVRRQSGLSRFTAAEFWATVPDTPGRHVAEFDVRIEVHDAMLANGPSSTGRTYVEYAPGDDAPPLVSVRVPCALEVNVAGDPAAPPRLVAGAAEPLLARTPEAPRRSMLVWTDRAASRVHVALQFHHPTGDLAHDVWLRHGDRATRIGWIHVRAGTVKYVGCSAPFAGLHDGDAVEIELRPAFGILRHPVRGGAIRDEVITIPATVAAPGHVVWRAAPHAAPEVTP